MKCPRVFKVEIKDMNLKYSQYLFTIWEEGI